MSIFRAAPLGAVCLVCAALAQAGEPSRPAAREHAGASAALAPALRTVWDASPAIAAARAELEAAAAKARAADRPLYNPELEFGAENADVNRRTAGVSLALDVSGKRRAYAARGEAGLGVARVHYDLQRRDVAARWLQAWSATAFAQRQRELGEHRLDLLRRFDELAERRLRIGDISSTERDLAGLALGEAQAQQAGLIGREAAARAALTALGGNAGIAMPPLPANLPPTTDSMPPAAVDALPELRQARAKLASADAETMVARRARIPDPKLGLTGGQVRAGPVTDQVVGISVSIPLPVLNTGRAELEAALAEAHAAAARVRAQRQLALAALQETRSRYGALRDAAHAFRGGRAAAFGQRTALLEKLWRAGELGTSDYLVQFKQNLDTALSGLELEDQAWQAWFDYLVAAGRLIDWVGARQEDPR